MASTAGFPVATRQAHQNVAGFPTEVLLQFFQDRTVVFLNQGKIGKIIQISPPTTNRRRAAQRQDLFSNEEDAEQPDSGSQTVHESLDGAFLPPPDASSSVTTLFGSSKSEELRQVEVLYASQIAAILFAKGKSPNTEEEEDSTPSRALREAKPIIVAFGLRPAFLEGKAAEEREALQSDIMHVQRDRFKGIMELVSGLL